MKTTLVTILYVIFVTLSSCSPVLYSSVGQNVPLFHEKGEVTLSSGYCETWDTRGFNVQFATAIDSNLALISSLYSMKGIDYDYGLGSDDDIWHGRGSYFEIGVGKFGYSSQSKLSYELFAGIGYGSMKNKTNYSSVDGKYIKPFIQPSIGISGGIVEFALTPRIGLVSYISNTNSMITPAYEERVDNFFNEKKNTLVFEPGATFRIGYRNVKIQAQYCYSTFKYESPDQESISPVNPEYISVGIHVLFSNRFK